MKRRGVPPFSGREAGPDGSSKPCDHPGCQAAGAFPAPKDRTNLRDFLWFCLDHVREYNRTWNFYEGMSADEVETFVREDVVGWRPTWPMGLKQGFGRMGAGIRDPFGFFADEAAAESARKSAGTDGPDGNGGSKDPELPERRAFALFELDPPVTLARLKARYKELVKRHHPDANGGDKAAEEKLKLINAAYGLLKRWCG